MFMFVTVQDQHYQIENNWNPHYKHYWYITIGELFMPIVYGLESLYQTGSQSWGGYCPGV